MWLNNMHTYEQTLLSRLTILRSEAVKQADSNEMNINSFDLKKRGQIEKNITEQLTRFNILAEDYPDLKAGKQYMELQKELSNIEDVLQHSRRFYNGAVRLLNTRIDTFPDLMIARLFHYQYRQYFQME